MRTVVLAATLLAAGCPSRSHSPATGGGTGPDDFRLAGGSLSGTIQGGTGPAANSLTADDVVNSWTVTAVDTGTVTGVEQIFQHYLAGSKITFAQLIF